MHKQAEAVEQVAVVAELEEVPVVGVLVAEPVVIQEPPAILEALQALDLDLAILRRALSPA